MGKVVPISRGKKDLNGDALQRAHDKFCEAVQYSGKKREQLLKEALEISEDLADAYTCMADGCKGKKKRVELYKKALATSERLLGNDWQSKYKGVGWGVLETRPPMRAMYGLALFLHEEKKLDEALELFRALMVSTRTTTKEFAIRWQRRSSKSNAMTNSRSYRGDVSASLLYTKALYLFRKQEHRIKRIKLLRLSATMFTCRYIFPRCWISQTSRLTASVSAIKRRQLHTPWIAMTLVRSPWRVQLDGTGVSKAAPKDVHEN